MEVMQIIQVVLGIFSGLLIVTGVLYIFSFVSFIEDDEGEIKE